MVKMITGQRDSATTTADARGGALLCQPFGEPRRVMHALPVTREVLRKMRGLVLQREDYSSPAPTSTKAWTRYARERLSLFYLKPLNPHGVQALTVGMMVAVVLAITGMQLKIGGAIVRSIPVLVVNNLTGLQVPTNHLFHDEPVFADVPARRSEGVRRKADVDISARPHLATGWLPPLDAKPPQGAEHSVLRGAQLDGNFLGRQSVSLVSLAEVRFGEQIPAHRWIAANRPTLGTAIATHLHRRVVGVGLAADLAGRRSHPRHAMKFKPMHRAPTVWSFV